MSWLMDLDGFLERTGIPRWYYDYIRPTPAHIPFGSDEFVQYWRERFAQLTPEQQSFVNEIKADSTPVDVPFEL